MKTYRNTTRAEYIERINSVLDFIENNLEANLSLEVLSKKVNYSSFHFHRLFLTIIGENLNQYISRKRVERIASILLTNYNRPIKELAFNYGFNSESSFSRTFKKYYGISPTKFKQEGKNKLSKIGIDPFTSEAYIYSIDSTNKWLEMNAQIVITELQEIKLAGIMHIGEFNEIEDMYRRLMKWGHEKDVLSTSNFKAITIYHDNPNVTEGSNVRYSTCLTINKNIEAEGEIRPVNIKKGLFAVGRFEIKGQDISRAWKNISTWIIENSYEFRDGEYFEIYHNDHSTHPEQKFILDICIPLERTANINIDKRHDINLSTIQEKNSPCTNQLSYHELIGYMKELRAFFKREYDTYFGLGNIYQGSPDFSYFSLTTENLKKQKLKFVIILNHKLMNFSICLSGQNKSIRKKTWEIFKYSDWDKYHLVKSISNSLSIIDHIIIDAPDFTNRDYLTKQIETESIKFIEELRLVLE